MPGRRFFEIGRRLIQQGHQVTVITGNSELGLPLGRKKIGLLQKDGMAIVVFNLGCPQVKEGAVSYTHLSDMGFKVYQIPYNKASHLLRDAIKLKFGIRPKKEECLRFFNHVKTSDIVANLLGICFSSRLTKGERGYLKSIKSVLAIFAISFVAKMNRVKTCLLYTSRCV